MNYPIQIILTRQLAGYLSVPLFLVDPAGDLIFYNEPAEEILGSRFEETGSLPLEKWWSAHVRFDEDGKPINRANHPLLIALAEKRPAYKRYRIHGGDGTARQIEATCIPIKGLQGELLGAVAIFWELAS